MMSALGMEECDLWKLRMPRDVPDTHHSLTNRRAIRTKQLSFYKRQVGEPLERGFQLILFLTAASLLKSSAIVGSIPHGGIDEEKSPGLKPFTWEMDFRGLKAPANPYRASLDGGTTTEILSEAQNDGRGRRVRAVEAGPSQPQVLRLRLRLRSG